MSFEPNTSLNLFLPNNEPNLDLELDPSSGPLTLAQMRVFSCNFCRRKFYSSQALGGHQNAHRLERTLAKKSRELSSAVRPHAGWNQRSAYSYGSSRPEHHGHGGRFTSDLICGKREMSYGSREEDGYCLKGYKSENVQEEFSHLDLSLRL